MALVRRRLCEARALDRTRQSNLSAQTINPVSRRMEVCRRVPARIATQNSRGKRSIFSTKQIGMKKSRLSGTLEYRAYPQNHLSDGPNSPYRLWPLRKDSGGPIDHRDNNAFCLLLFPHCPQRPPHKLSYRDLSI